MSRDDCDFTWHPNQDDGYDGANCGSRTVSGAPSAFNKNQPYGFTMAADPGTTLTLEVTATATDSTTYWGTGSTSAGPSKFELAYGTFVYSSKGGSLCLGNSAGTGKTLIFNVTGLWTLDAAEVTGLNLAEIGTPSTLIYMPYGGTAFSVAANHFSGGFTAEIVNTARMQVRANKISLTNGIYTAFGEAPSGPEGYNLDFITGSVYRGPAQGIFLSEVFINCKNLSNARLRSTGILFSNTSIRAANDTAVNVNCDGITINGNSAFNLFGYATFTFSNENGTQKLPFTFSACPKGMFNFNTDGGNGGRFRFRAKDSAEAASQYNAMISAQMVAIDGTPWTGTAINGYVLDNAGWDGTFQIIRVIKTT